MRHLGKCIALLLLILTSMPVTAQIEGPELSYIDAVNDAMSFARNNKIDLSGMYVAAVYHVYHEHSGDMWNVVFEQKDLSVDRQELRFLILERNRSVSLQKHPNNSFKPNP